MNALVAPLRRFTIRTRMLGAVVMVMTMFVLFGAAVLLAGAEIAEINKRFIGHALHELESASRVKEHMAALRLVEKQMVIDYDDGVTVLKLRERWAAELAATRKSLQSLLEGEEDADNAAVRAALERLAAYEKGLEAVLLNMQNGSYDNARAADRMLARPQAEIGAAEEHVAKVLEIVRGEVGATRAELERMMTALQWALAGALLLVLAVVAPLTLANSRSITGPIARAREAALAIASGDLTRRIEVVGRDESADLLAALARMEAGLARLVHDLHNASQSLQVASVEVASGNADLSARTEQTAGNLQQAASALTQLSATVDQTAQSARSASELAGTASSVAQRGGEVVGQVVATMGEISASSRRIADIIGTIDGIAFQTNILALNAAVEAARAGEQGRGFAVVAGEVRSLAQRSAEAAREIKSLIGGSVEKVESGARLVADAGRTMSEIVASVQRVADIIGEISAAAGEQSQGVQQVSGTVSQLDQATQQNAALVEQSAAAAESLKEQSRQLAALVATFKIDADAVPLASAQAAATPAPARAPVNTDAAVAQRTIAKARQAPAVPAAPKQPAATPAATPVKAPAQEAVPSPPRRLTRDR
ncbi:MAG: methyl-accepting chemotaxis protein [Rubrivivax sp.]